METEPIQLADFDLVEVKSTEKWIRKVYMNYRRLTATAMIVLLWLEIWQRKSFGMKPNYIKTKRTQATEYIMATAQNLKRQFHSFRILAKLKRKVALHTGGMEKINLKYLISTNGRVTKAKIKNK